MIRAILTLLTLAACSPPPDQPALRTYGILQPLCILGCRQSLTLADGDGAVTLTETTTRNVNGP